MGRACTCPQDTPLACMDASIAILNAAAVVQAGNSQVSVTARPARLV